MLFEREKEKTAIPRRVIKAIAKTPKILNKTNEWFIIKQQITQVKRLTPL